jgi:hypothetical protein
MNAEAQNLLDDVKVALADAGVQEVDDAEIMRVLGKAVANELPSEATPLWHISEDDLVLLGERISSALRAAGLKGPALDQALAAAFREAIRAIDRERSKDWSRRATLKVVK